MERRGRPKKDDSRKIRYTIRLSIEEWDKLEEICNELGLSKSESIRKCIDLMFSKIFKY